MQVIIELLLQPFDTECSGQVGGMASYINTNLDGLFRLSD